MGCWMWNAESKVWPPVVQGACLPTRVGRDADRRNFENYEYGRERVGRSNRTDRGRYRTMAERTGADIAPWQNGPGPISHHGRTDRGRYHTVAERTWADIVPWPNGPGPISHQGRTDRRMDPSHHGRMDRVNDVTLYENENKKTCLWSRRSEVKSAAMRSSLDIIKYYDMSACNTS